MTFTKKLLPVAITSALLLGATGATAGELSGNVTLVSDYLFRGISQTDEKGAIQGGFDYAADNGLYTGIWASNVNYGTDSSTEMDYYVGFGGETSGGLGYDVSYIYFDYEGDSEFDYQEIAISFSKGDLTVGLNYSDEYLGDGGPDFIYPYISYGFSLPSDVSLSLHVGFSDADADDFFEAGEDSYTDYSVGLAKEIMGVEFGLTYADTTLDDTDAADDRIVLSLSKSL